MDVFYFESVEPLESGGLGTVDIVRITGGEPYPVGARFARKRLGEQWKNDPGAKGRFDREIEMLAEMSHTNIVSHKGQHLPGGEAFYMMPLYPTTLRKVLVAHGKPITKTWVLTLAIKIARALAYAHAKNFIHRDLKPENVLMTAQHEPVVADWGLGQFIHQHSKVLDLKTRGGLGTPYYCPMEQWTSGRCEASGDVYSLGLMIAEMLLGDRYTPAMPFGGITSDIVTNDSPGSVRLNAVLKKMTSMFAVNRHQSMDEVVTALSGCY